MQLLVLPGGGAGGHGAQKKALALLEGGEARLECAVSANPPPDAPVKWFFNQLAIDDGYLDSFGTTQSRLIASVNH